MENSIQKARISAFEEAAELLDVLADEADVMAIGSYGDDDVDYWRGRESTANGIARMLRDFCQDLR